MAESENHCGRVLGEFVLRERLASGGFGTVYRCDQPLLRREVVVKVLHQRLHRHDVALQRFVREAQLASRLDHPYAAHVYAFGIEEQDGLIWIAMELVQGITLNSWLEKYGPLPIEQFVPFFDRVAEVVQAAHERGIVHRDLKPSNIMVTERAGRLSPKLLDFGIAKLLDEVALPTLPGWSEAFAVHEPSIDVALAQTPDLESTAPLRMRVAAPVGRPESRLTRTSAAVGSPPYMSPEQWTTPMAVGPASDLYALGVVAYEALTGRQPFTAGNADDYGELHCHAPIPPVGGKFPPAVDRLFQRALAKRAEDRWGSALEIAAALRTAAGLGGGSIDLPRLDDSVRRAWRAEAPQPLAELVVELDGARNAHQARDSVQELVRTLLRYLLAIALATHAQLREDRDDSALLELLRGLRQRELSADERVRLLRLLVRPSIGRRSAHPIPALVDLVTPDSDGNDRLEPILVLHAMSELAGNEDTVRVRLVQLMPVLAQLLRSAEFVLDYALIVRRDGASERWTGLRRERRPQATVYVGELLEYHPMLLDRRGRVCADLWPLMQAVAQTEATEPELFLFDHGARLVASAALVRHDVTAWEWIATRVLAEIERRAQMREQVRFSAQQWQDRARPDGLLWRGDVLADLERWTRSTTAVVFSEPEASFVEASRRYARRAVRNRRLLGVLAVAGILSGVQYRSTLNARMAEERLLLQTRAAEQLVTQAEVEQGRAALLHGESAEAQRHLEEAYRRGDRSPSTTFMYGRALQPRRAELARFPSISGRMWSAAFSPDGRRIVATDDLGARVWDAQTHQPLFSLLHGGAAVYHAIYSSDGTTLATAGEDGVVKLWDATSGTLLRELAQEQHDGNRSPYAFVAMSPDGRHIAAIDTVGAVAHVWNATNGVPLAELRNDALDSPAIAFSADGRWLATSGGNDIRVFDTNTWRVAITLAGPRIRSLSFDPTGPRLVSGSFDGDVTLWAIPSGGRIRHLRQIGEPVDAIAFSPDGELVVAASRDGAEQIWNVKSGRLHSQLNYLHGKITAVEFDATSRYVLAAGASGAVVVADVALGMAVSVLEGPANVVRSAHFDPSSRRVVGASWDGTARMWDATPPYRRWSSPPVSGDCGVVASLEPDRRFVAIGCRDLTTHIWDTARDQLLAELPSVTPVDGAFMSAFPAVSAEGELAAIARGNTVEIYALPGGALVRTVEHPAAVSAVAFASVGRDVVSGSIDGSLVVTRDGRPSVALPRSTGGIDAAAFLPDGRVVAADTQSRVRVYDPDRNAVLAELVAPIRAMLLRPSRDGRSLITVPSYTKAAPPALWDLEHYQLIAQLEGHVGHVRSVRFVNADREILTTGGDGSARLWEAATGRLRQTYRGSSRFLADATLDPEGFMVVGGGGDGLLRFWEASSGRLLWTLQAHKSHVIGIHFEGGDIVTRGFGGDVSRWSLPSSDRVIQACGTAQSDNRADHEPCAIVAK